MNQDTTKDVDSRVLVCPHCHSQLSLCDGGLLCQSCDREYPTVCGIPNFCEKDEYWCNVSRQKMQELNAKAMETGDWLRAAKELIPEYLDHIESSDRADAQFLWPTTSKSRILDAGSMWGGLTLPVAQHCGEVFATDKTVETLAFLKIRAEQMGFSNVNLVASGLGALPFPNGYFDMVILSGVLESVAFEQEVVLEIHWGKRRTDSAKYSKNHRQVQVEALREIQRVLKPGGYLIVACERLVGSTSAWNRLKKVTELLSIFKKFILKRHGLKKGGIYRDASGKLSYEDRHYRDSISRAGFICHYQQLDYTFYPNISALASNYFGKKPS